jgi:hypothetical protein
MLDAQTFALIGVCINILTAGVAIGLHKQTQKFQGDRINAHELEISKLKTEKADHQSTWTKLTELDREKVDALLHGATVARLEGDIRNVGHRAANVDQRVHALETRR